jgi:hypothetical protein
MSALAGSAGPGTHILLVVSVLLLVVCGLLLIRVLRYLARAPASQSPPRIRPPDKEDLASEGTKRLRSRRLPLPTMAFAD